MAEDFWRHFRLPLIWAAILFILSSIPDFTPPVHLSKWDDKWIHVIIYLPLGYLLMRAFHLSRPARPALGLLLLTLLLGASYGISDEIHQYFVPGRFMDWRDAVADAAGVLVGSCLYLLQVRRRRKQQSEIH